MKLLMTMMLLAGCLTGLAHAQPVCAQREVADTPAALNGDYRNLWKNLRWTVRYDGADAVAVMVQYQKQKHLLCWGDVCHQVNGNPWDWDNRSKLDDWHITINYTGIKLGPANDAGLRLFSQDYISGRISTSHVLSGLRVAATGKLSIVQPPGGITLTSGGC